MTGHGNFRGDNWLVGVSICVHYSDYLAFVIENKRHFDVWIIVTTPDDCSTQELCKRENVVCLISKALHPFGVGFNAAYNKSVVINEALDYVESRYGSNVWLALVDSDTYLPRCFRQRLEAQMLEIGSIYGLAGRRVCSSAREFAALKRAEPWQPYLERNQTIIGYFNLFHLQGSINRYLPSKQDGSQGHDDWRFFWAFGEGNRHSLPISALHIGHVARNWFGRTSDDFRNDVAVQQSEVSVCPLALNEISKIGPQKLVALQVGGFYGDDTALLASFVKQTYIVDQSGIFSSAEADSVVTADREAVAKIFYTNTANADNVTVLGVNSSSACAKIRDRSIDVVYLSGEATYRTLLDFLAIWEEKLKSDTMFLGFAFGVTTSSNATAAVRLILRGPVQGFKDGSWLARGGNRSAGVGSAVAFEKANSKWHSGVIIVTTKESSFEKAISAMYRATRDFGFACSLFQVGPEIAALRVACYRLGVVYSEFCEDINAIGNGAKKSGLIRLLEIAMFSPYPRTLVLDSDSDFVGHILGSFIDKADTESTRIWIVAETQSIEAAWFRRDDLPSDQMFREFAACEGSIGCSTSSRTENSISQLFTSNTTVLTENHKSGFPSAGALSNPDFKYYSEVLKFFNIEVMVRSDTALIFPITADALIDFQRLCGAVKLSEQCRVVVCLFGITEEQLNGAVLSSRQIVISQNLMQVEITDEDLVRDSLVLAIPHVKEEFIVFMDPALRPSPGANFMHEELEKGVSLYSSRFSFHCFNSEVEFWNGHIECGCGSARKVSSSLPRAPFVVCLPRLGFPMVAMSREIAQLIANAAISANVTSVDLSACAWRCSKIIRSAIAQIDCSDHGWLY